MAKNKTYHEEMTQKNSEQLRQIVSGLPTFTKEYFNYLQSTTEIRTRVNYAIDLRTFLFFLQKQNPAFSEKELSQITLEDISRLHVVDIEEYMSFLESYTDAEGKQRTNSDAGKNRKLASLRNFFNYYVTRKFLEYSPAAAVKIKKPHIKPIIHLEQEEIEDLFNYMDNLEKALAAQESICADGDKKKYSQRLQYFKKTKYRDTAILMTILGTGIRVSECVGLDITDIDFKKKMLKVVRKGGDIDTVYFNDEVERALREYIEIERPIYESRSKNENALFYSMQGTRLGVRAIENMVKKYAGEVVPLKEITVHKLRSTFATSVYRSTSDIYKVSKALGHKSLNMVRRYANSTEEDKIAAAESISLRKK